MTGEVIDGRYRLVSMLGRGGMGVVWRAEHLALRSQVALKLLNPMICQSPEAIRRFQCEAQTAAGMRSANVVRIIDSGVEWNTPFIAMKLLEGETLASRLKRLGSLTCYDA